VEAFLSFITRQVLRRGDFTAVADLIAAIQGFIDAWNDRCLPNTRTKDPDTVIAKATHPRHRKAQIASDTEHWQLPGPAGTGSALRVTAVHQGLTVHRDVEGEAAPAGCRSC
jgi:hypothetical protein